MIDLLDPFATQKSLWRTMGSMLGSNPLINRDDIDKLQRLLETQNALLRRTAPRFSTLSGDLAAEYFGGADDALRKRGL